MYGGWWFSTIIFRSTWPAGRPGPTNRVSPIATLIFSLAWPLQGVTFLAAHVIRSPLPFAGQLLFALKPAVLAQPLPVEEQCLPQSSGSLLAYSGMGRRFVAWLRAPPADLPLRDLAHLIASARLARERVLPAWSARFELDSEDPGA